jgi:hypothetical protein
LGHPGAAPFRPQDPKTPVNRTNHPLLWLPARHYRRRLLGTITDAGSSTPLVAISSEVYAFAHQQTASSAIVEVHALASEKLLWSTTVSGQVHSLAAGGSRILLSVVVAPSATQAYEAAPVNRRMWMDPTHHAPQPLGTAWGTPSLSLDGSTAAWFDASQPDCHSLDVDDLATGKSSTRVTLSSASPERLCAVTADVFQGQTTVAWTPTDFRGSSFLAVWQSDGPSYAVLGLPTMSWIGLQGRTLAAVAERGCEAINVDLDLVESVLSRDPVRAGAAPIQACGCAGRATSRRTVVSGRSRGHKR